MLLRACSRAALPVRSRANSTMIAELQVLPSPLGTPTDEFKHVDAAIAIISASGLPHAVHALGTTIEGHPDEVWRTARAAFEASLASGAKQELMILKLYQGERTVSELLASGQACAANATGRPSSDSNGVADAAASSSPSDAAQPREDAATHAGLDVTAYSRLEPPPGRRGGG